MSTREIAARLHVSIKTVETHRAHIKSKLNLGSASQLIQFCVRWVDQSPHVVRSDTAGVDAIESQAPFTAPVAEVAASRKFAPAASITTLVRTRSRSISTRKAG